MARGATSEAYERHTVSADSAAAAECAMPTRRPSDGADRTDASRRCAGEDVGATGVCVGAGQAGADVLARCCSGLGPAACVAQPRPRRCAAAFAADCSARETGRKAQDAALVGRSVYDVRAGRGDAKM